MAKVSTMHELHGKAAIVTGASRGIGAATAAQLASSGVSVILAARSESQIRHNADIIRETGGQAEAVTCDAVSYTHLTLPTIYSV